MTDNKHDEDVVSQLMNFGYSREQIIEASKNVVDYKDINAVQNRLDSNTNTISTQPSSVKKKKVNKSSKNTKSSTKSTKSLKFQFPPPSVNKMSYSKSVSTPKTKKMKKKNANSWIKQDSNKNDASAPAAFSRQASIMKLRQIASVSKTKKKPKMKTLVDIIYESDEEEEETPTNDDDNEDALMPPILDRRFGLSADTGMNELLNQKNKELTETNDDIHWMKQKKKKKKNHLKAELSLLFDFRDFESKNNRTKEYEQSIEHIQSDKATKAMELMKQKTFNAVKLKQDIKDKAIEGFTARLEVQKKLMKEGFTSSPLINDDDFEVNEDENDQDEDVEQKKLDRRDILKQALKNEETAMEHCVMIVEELGFLKYMKDDETYMQLLRSKQNALQRELTKKKQKMQSLSPKSAQSPKNAKSPSFGSVDVDIMAMDYIPLSNRSSASNMDIMDDNDNDNDEKEMEFDIGRSRSSAAQMALDEIKQEMEEEKKNAVNKEPYDLFNMSNSNLLLSLKQTNCHLLMRIISRSIVMIKSLRFIELCNCGVDDYFMSQICLQLLQNKDEFEINTLSLQSNSIADNGILCLCELIKVNNKYLKVIKLQNNRRDISTGVCKQICQALEINDYVIKFAFEFRHYGEKDRSYQALKRNIDRARVERVANMSQ